MKKLINNLVIQDIIILIYVFLITILIQFIPNNKIIGFLLWVIIDNKAIFIHISFFYFFYHVLFIKKTRYSMLIIFLNFFIMFILSHIVFGITFLMFFYNG